MKFVERYDRAKKKLFCFDFDETLVKGHFHHLIHDAKRDARNHKIEFDQVEFVNSLLENESKGLRNRELLKLTFETILNSRNEVAITSFSSFPDAIVQSLEKLELEVEQLNRIKIFSGLPKGRDDYKNKHIEKAMLEFSIEDKGKVFLIDDDYKNCEQAVRAGFNTIIVNKLDNEGQHLQEIIKICSQSRQLQEYSSSKDGQISSSNSR